MTHSKLLFGLATCLFLAGCFFEAGGCTGNACVYVSDDGDECYGDHCDEPVACEDANAIAARMASVITEARSHARSCGGVSYSAAGSVLWNDRLSQAAALHSADMAENNFLSHIGSDGLGPAERALEAGYDYARISENVGGGQSTSTAVISAWLDSPEHCAALMDPLVNEIGAACARNNRADLQTYWTLMLGSPQTP
ncbi:CAP domain-containing protein [Granulosicoccaceae sp. 1_MG-2023]|nr:CAP domain-containing protein [Granulosicoccaceae sp. 1_MG-2023]